MKAKNKSNLLLIELILAVLFFSLTASICVKVIFSAGLISRKNSILTKANITSDSLVSILKERNLKIVDKTIKNLYPDVQNTEDKVWNLYFDDYFENTNQDNARYLLSVTISQKDYLRDIVIRVNDLKNKDSNNSAIYSLNTSNFIQGGVEIEK